MLLKISLEEKEYIRQKQNLEKISMLDIVGFYSPRWYEAWHSKVLDNAEMENLFNDLCFAWKEQ